MSGTASTRSVVILGATSAMARAATQAFARDGYSLVLGARNPEENERIAADLRIRFQAPCHALPFDALAFDTHEAFVDACHAVLDTDPTGIVVFFGFMAEQVDAQNDFALARAMIDANLSGVISVVERFAARFEHRKSGFIGIVSSVAGDRGRQSNYIYGASKAGLSAYTQGLRNRLFASGVTVTTIKPGFVDTKMTYGLPLPGPLVATAEQAGNDIHRAVVRGKNIAYVPFFWRYLMIIIRAIPEWQFKKMTL